MKKLIHITWALWLVVLMAMPSTAAAQGVGLNKQRIMRNPVSVLAAPDWFTLSNQVVSVGIEIQALSRYQSQFGVTIKEEDWDHGMDLLIKHLAEAESVRPKLETNLADAKKAGCAYVLFTRFEEKGGNMRVLSALVDLPRKDVMGVMDASSQSLELACRRVVKQVETKLALVRWTATVMKLSKKNAVINRGFNDGVRKNMKFNVTSVGTDEKSEKEPTELRLLTAERSGTCTVLETSENYAIVKADQEDFEWKVGDLISLPSVMLDKRDPSSKGRAAWDAVYEKNKK